MLGFSGVAKKLNTARVTNTITYARLISLTRHHQDLELLGSRWNAESHTFVASLETDSYLGRYGKVDEGVTVDKLDVDRSKLKYLTIPTGCFETLGKSTSAACLKFIDEGDDSRSGYVLEVFCFIGFLGILYQAAQKMA